MIRQAPGQIKSPYNIGASCPVLVDVLRTPPNLSSRPLDAIGRYQRKVDMERAARLPIALIRIGQADVFLIMTCILAGSPALYIIGKSVVDENIPRANEVRALGTVNSPHLRQASLCSVSHRHRRTCRPVSGSPVTSFLIPGQCRYSTVSPGRPCPSIP